MPTGAFDQETVYDKYRSRLELGGNPRRIPIENQPDDSRFEGWLKGVARKNQEFWGGVDESVGRGIENVSGAVTSARDAITAPFRSPSTAPVTAETLQAQPTAAFAPPTAPPSDRLPSTPAEAATPPIAPTPGGAFGVPATAPQSGVTTAGAKAAVPDKAVLRQKAKETAATRAKQAPTPQQEGAAKLLKDNKVDVESAFKTAAPELAEAEFTENEKAWFLVEFGLRMMAVGGQPGATFGGAAGIAGAETLGSMRKEKKAQRTEAKEARAEKKEDAKYADERGDKLRAEYRQIERDKVEDRRWKDSYQLSKQRLRIQELTADRGRYGDVQADDQNRAMVFDKDTRTFRIVLDENDNPVTIQGKEGLSTAFKESDAITGKVAERLKNDIVYMRERDPAKRSEIEESHRAEVLKGYPEGQRGAFGGGGEPTPEPPITEEAIRETMRIHKMTRDQVLTRLRAEGRI